MFVADNTADWGSSAGTIAHNQAVPALRQVAGAGTQTLQSTHEIKPGAENIAIAEHTVPWLVAPRYPPGGMQRGIAEQRGTRFDKDVHQLCD